MGAGGARAPPTGQNFGQFWPIFARFFPIFQDFVPFFPIFSRFFQFFQVVPPTKKSWIHPCGGKRGTKPRYRLKQKNNVKVCKPGSNKAVTIYLCMMYKAHSSFTLEHFLSLQIMYDNGRVM